MFTRISRFFKAIFNAILGEDRVIVSEIAGTTRDAIDTPFEYAGKQLTLIDTAGIRRRVHQTQGADFFAARRTERALERAERSRQTAAPGPGAK